MNYLIPAILTLIGGYILWQIKRDKVSLVYAITESDSFPRDEGVGKYFVIKLRNKGNKAIENIAVNVEFDANVIDTISFSDEKLISGIDKTNSYIKGNLNLLNPKEVFSVTITATAYGGEKISTPKIVARAIGATATPLAENVNIKSFSQGLTLATVAAALSIYTGYTAWNVLFSSHAQSLRTIESLRRETTSKTEKLDDIIRREEQGEPETQQQIFSIFNRSGISHLFPDLIEKNGHVEYWKTGAYLMHRFLEDVKNRGKYISAMEKLIVAGNMAPSSLGFNLYLLAKMEQHVGSTDKALKYLEQCQQKAPLMYDFLMAQDPSYDTKSLESILGKKKSKNPN